MTSLIFGSVYMAHQGIVAHKRGKQRQKNYERWEDLRDEYDAQKKIGRERESRSLDIQRTGAWDGGNGGYGGGEYTAREERPILTLRDQQEANDARMSWRPQEMWEQPQQQTGNPNNPLTVPQRHASLSAIPPYLQPQPTAQYQPPQQPPLPHSISTPSQYWQARGEIKPQKTGATWDDGLPPPLQVTRRTYEDYEYPSRRYSTPPQGLDQSGPPSRTNSQRQSTSGSIVPSRTATPPISAPASVPPPAPVNTDPVSMDALYARLADTSISSTPAYTHVQAPSNIPGGRMAELIERGY